MKAIRSISAWIIGVGLIAVMFPLTILIWFLTFPFDSERIIVHRWVQTECRLLLLALPLWRVRAEGTEKRGRGESFVIVSNHQSILDIVLLSRVGGDFRWVSKSENFSIPVVGQTMRMAKYIELSRGRKESVMRMMERAVETLDKNISVLIFPEGTRSENGLIGRFKTGAFQIAVRKDRPVLPVVIDGTGNVLPRGCSTLTGGHLLRIRVLDPVYPDSFPDGDPDQVAVMVREAMCGALKDMRSEG